MARSFLKKSEEGPSIRTITSASAREYTREFLSPSEMQPYEVAEILGSDIDNGLTKAGVAHARRKYGSNIIKEELSLSFGQSLKKQLLGIHGLLVLLCAVILYIFTPDPLYMLLAVCAAAVTLVNAYLESRSQKAIKSTSCVPQHTSVPSAHFFAYHAVFTVFSTQKPPLHSPT